MSVADRIAQRLADWHAGAEPGEQSPYAQITVLGPAGQQGAQVLLTYRQAAELAAWQAGVTSTTCTPWAMADVLRGWINPAPDTAAATVVFAEPDGSDPTAVVLGPDDADRFVTTLDLGIEDRRMNQLLIRTSSPYQRGQRVRVRDDAGGAAAGRTGTIGWVTVAHSHNPAESVTFWYDVHLDDGDDDAHPQTFTPEELAPLTGAGTAGSP